MEKTQFLHALVLKFSALNALLGDQLAFLARDAHRALRRSPLCCHDVAAAALKLEHARRRTELRTLHYVQQADFYDLSDQLQDRTADARLVLLSTMKVALRGAREPFEVPLLSALVFAELAEQAEASMLRRLTEAGMSQPRFAVSVSTLRRALFQTVRALGPAYVETGRTLGQREDVVQAGADYVVAIIEAADAALASEVPL